MLSKIVRKRFVLCILGLGVMLSSQMTAKESVKIEFDVLEDFSTLLVNPISFDFFGNPVPPPAPGFFPKGSTLIFQGDIYPSGTLAAAGCGNNVVCNPAKAPIGSFFANGRLSADIAINTDPQAFTAPFVFYLFFKDRKGNISSKIGIQLGAVLVGSPFPDGSVPVCKAVIGGTGPFKHATGSAFVTVIGSNILDPQSPTVSSTYCLDLKGVNPKHPEVRALMKRCRS